MHSLQNKSNTSAGILLIPLILFYDLKHFMMWYNYCKGYYPFQCALLSATAMTALSVVYKQYGLISYIIGSIFIEGFIEYKKEHIYMVDRSVHSSVRIHLGVHVLRILVTYATMFHSNFVFYFIISFMSAMILSVFVQFLRVGSPALIASRISYVNGEEIISQHMNQWEQVESVSDESCCICMTEFQQRLEEGVEIVKAPCEHQFCRICIQEWMLRKSSCPICRRSLLSQGQ